MTEVFYRGDNMGDVIDLIREYGYLYNYGFDGNTCILRMQYSKRAGGEINEATIEPMTHVILTPQSIEYLKESPHVRRVAPANS